MKKVGNFQTEDKDRLSEQLDRFQDAVDTETQDIRVSFMPLPKQLGFTGGTANAQTLVTGQIALCDSNLGNITVSLAPPVGLVPGWSAVIKRFAANNVTVTPSGISAPSIARRINATTSKVYTAVGVFWIYFDGLDWWA